MSDQKIVVLTEGFSNPVTAKTGTSVIRYRSDDVVSVLDQEHAGKSANELFGVGEGIPVVASLDEAPEANTLLIGTAPAGGRIPAAWRATIQAALSRGMHVVSGLHEFISEDAEFTAAAEQGGGSIQDIRKNNEKDVHSGEDLGNECIRIHAVGNDCSLGKMIVSVELDRALRAKGYRSQFLATGQTGIMISGEGIPIDCVVADFVNGAAEKLVRKYADCDFVVVEGQGSLAHPRYSGVTLGLMHGCQPQGLVLCYEAGRETMHGVGERPVRSLRELKDACETVGRLVHPTEVIGVALNGRRMTAEQAEAEKSRVREELGLPVCDPLRDGCDELVAAAEALRERLQS